MSSWMFVLPSAVLVGLGRRVAGGVLNQWFMPVGERVFGDYPARAIYGGTCAAAALAGGATWWQALAVLVAVFLGCAMPNRFTVGSLGEFGGIDLGHNDGLPVWRGWLGLTLHGVISFAGVTGLVVLIGHPAWPGLGSAVIAPLYWVGWRLSGLLGNSRYPVGFHGGAELGEFLWGCALGACLVGAFVL